MKNIALTIALLSFAPTGWAGETLYNGIVLPNVWPPQRSVEELRRLEVMPVPYLKSPPKVIPIDVGRQLFVDDFLIEQTNLRRVFHETKPYEKNPVFRPERLWETFNHVWGLPQTTMPFSDGVWWDPREQVFKMWYMAYHQGFTALARSQDGLNWERPALDVFPGTNIVHHSPLRDSNTVWLDHQSDNPAQRFKMLLYNRSTGRGSLHTSPDGIHWSAPVWTDHLRDRSTFFYNPFRKKWIFSLRAPYNTGPLEYRKPPYRQMGRARRYSESDDFLMGAKWGASRDGQEWKPGEPVYWTASDRLDNDGVPAGELVSELYNLDATPYESLMVGLFSVLKSNRKPGLPKVNQIYFGFSRDGFHWDRPHRESTIPVDPNPKAWNSGNVQSVGGGCIVMGDRLYFYHSGRSEDYSPPEPANATKSDGATMVGHSRPGGRYQQTGVAFLRRDGFASMEGTGTLTTRSLTFRGRHLFVNAVTPKGELRAEVLDAQGKVIAPFTLENCLPLKADSTKAQLTWKGTRDLSALAGKAIKLRFQLKDGSLYAFWISPDASGASYGYVAGGGPGFTGSRDTTGGPITSAGRIQ